MFPALIWVSVNSLYVTFLASLGGGPNWCPGRKATQMRHNQVSMTNASLQILKPMASPMSTLPKNMLLRTVERAGHILSSAVTLRPNPARDSSDDDDDGDIGYLKTASSR